MRKADGSFYLVHILATGTTGTESIPADVGRVNFNVNGIVDDRVSEYRGKRGVPPAAAAPQRVREEGVQDQHEDDERGQVAHPAAPGHPVRQPQDPGDRGRVLVQGGGQADVEQGVDLAPVVEDVTDDKGLGQRQDEQRQQAADQPGQDQCATAAASAVPGGEPTERTRTRSGGGRGVSRH